MAVIATGRYATTQNLAVLAARTARLLRTTPVGIVNVLTSTPSAAGIADAKKEFADMANRINGQIIADVASLRRNASSVTVAASGNSVGIPADVHRNQIYDVQYVNSSDALNLLPCQWIGKQDARRLPTRVQNGEYVGQYAQFVALDPTEENLLFYPWLASETTFTVLFQEAPDLFVAADFDDPTSTTYAAVPDEFNNVLPSLLAFELATIMRDSERRGMLEVDLFGKQTNGFTGIYRKFRMAMGEVPSNTNNRRYSYSNGHPNALSTPYSGINFGSGPNGRFSSS